MRPAIDTIQSGLVQGTFRSVFLRIKRRLSGISETSSGRLRPARFLLAVAAVVGSFLAAGTAHAQSGTFYLDRAQISGAPDDGFMVWRPSMAEKTRFYANAILGYSHNPLRSDTVASNPGVQSRIDNPVEGQFITYLSAGSEIAN